MLLTQGLVRIDVFLWHKVQIPDKGACRNRCDCIIEISLAGFQSADMMGPSYERYLLKCQVFDAVNRRQSASGLYQNYTPTKISKMKYPVYLGKSFCKSYCLVKHTGQLRRHINIDRCGWDVKHQESQRETSRWSRLVSCNRSWQTIVWSLEALADHTPGVETLRIFKRKCRHAEHNGETPSLDGQLHHYTNIFHGPLYVIQYRVSETLLSISHTEDTQLPLTILHSLKEPSNFRLPSFRLSINHRSEYQSQS